MRENLDGEFSFEQSEGTYCASNKLDAFDYYVLQGKTFTTFNDLSKLTSSSSASADVFVVKGNEITSDTVFNVIKLGKLQQILEVPKSERDTAFNQLNFLKDRIKKDIIAGDRVDYGKAKFNGRELDAIEVELRIASKNRLVGKYSEYCQRIQAIKDDDFEMWRNFEIGNCDVTSVTREWKNDSSFASLWIIYSLDITSSQFPISFWRYNSTELYQ
ncbi:hypothetical protein N9D98_09625 [Amylibacter sp.]|nr:hypothetical protein [Amylibacter sp.]